MKVLPTLEGGLCILPESKGDWVELELICSDAVQPAHLAESLADLLIENAPGDLDRIFWNWGRYQCHSWFSEFSMANNPVNACL